MYFSPVFGTVHNCSFFVCSNTALEAWIEAITIVNSLPETIFLIFLPSNSTSLISINEEEPTHFTTEINNKENDSKNEYKKLYENLFQNYTKLIEINNNNNKKFKNLSVNKKFFL